VTAISDGLLDELRVVVGGDHVVTDPEITVGYAVDWTGRFRGGTPVVVRPADAAEVAGVVGACAAAGTALVPQGGNTGLVGGSVPLDGEVVLSLRRLRSVGEVDLRAGQVTVGAGATLAEVQAHVRPHGLAVGVDLSPRDSCTIGGMVATNAGGINVVRHGTMRRQVVGVEAVLGDGAVVSHLAGLAKDNTGYDLAGLLTGSEGTLGIVTAVRLALVAIPAQRIAIALGFADLPAAIDATAHLRRSLADLEAVEVMFADGVALVAEHIGDAVPEALAAPVSLLVEVAGSVDPLEQVADALETLPPSAPLAGEPSVAATPEQRDRLWRFRERHSEAINSLGPPVKLDVSLPPGAMAAFVHALPGVLPPTVRLTLFGHLGDGNLHVNISGVLSNALTAEEVRTADEVEEAVLRAVVHHGGSISAEHGIGTVKARYLHLCRSPQEIAAFRAIKRALDPHGILNPAALLPPD
jgi:FAD/FMN-containing dehydrogenase